MKNRILKINILFVLPILMVTACLEKHENSTPNNRQPGANNIVAMFFSDAELQIETKNQISELKQALEDAINMPVEQLKEQRYTGYTMENKSLDFLELIFKYYVNMIYLDPERFYNDLKKPEGMNSIRERISELEESYRLHIY